MKKQRRSVHYFELCAGWILIWKKKNRKTQSYKEKSKNLEKEIAERDFMEGFMENDV